MTFPQKPPPRSSLPRPGELRAWSSSQVQSNRKGNLFLITRVAVAPGGHWSSETTANAVYYLEDGVEDWQYIETVRWNSVVVEPPPQEVSEITRESEINLGNLSNSNH